MTSEKAVQLIYDLATCAHGTATIADALTAADVAPPPGRGAWTSVLVAAVLRDPRHNGTAVSAEVWERAQRRPKPARYPLAGLITCGLCGSPFDGATVKLSYGSYRYYLCRRRRRAATACRAPSMNADMLEDAIWTEVLARSFRRIHNPAPRARDLLRLLRSAAEDETARAEIFRRAVHSVVVRPPDSAVVTLLRVTAKAAPAKYETAVINLKAA